MSELSDWIKSRLIPALSATKVFGVRETRERTVRTTCPIHGGNDKNFAINTVDLTWFCHSQCGRGGGPFEFLDLQDGGDGRPRGKRFVALAKQLAERAGIDFPAPQRTVDNSYESEEPSAGLEQEFWTRCLPILSSPQAIEWARSRGFDPEEFSTFDLCRVSPMTDLPPFAGFRRKNGGWSSWASQGNIIVTPLYDVDGVLRSFRFRSALIGNSGSWPPKSAGPSAKGLVMASNGLLEVLRGASRPSWWDESAPLAIAVSEGEPDFFTWEVASSLLGDDVLSYPLSLGFVAGSITEGLFSKFASGTRIVVNVHNDMAGSRYLARIASIVECFPGLSLEVRRAINVGGRMGR